MHEDNERYQIQISALSKCISDFESQSNEVDREVEKTLREELLGQVAANKK